MKPVIVPYKGIWPKISASAYIAPGVVIMGDVEIGEETSVWPGCVLRGDVNIIRIGARTNIQDGTVVHVTHGGQGTHIGNSVTIGHMALLHDCTLDDHAFVGMKSAVIDRARVEGFSMLGAMALLTQGKVVPSGQLWLGAPAKFARELCEDEKQEIAHRAVHYVGLSRNHVSEN